jgi:phospholipase/carboxylesterase
MPLQAEAKAMDGTDPKRSVSRTIRLADLDLRIVEGPGDVDAPNVPIVVLLHGFSMTAGDLTPFGASMGLPALFLFPEGPIDLVARGHRGRAWWMIDVAARDADMARGRDRDLSAEQPVGLPSAREGLSRLLSEVGRMWPARPIFLGGFSQGAILSLEVTARLSFRPAGLVLLSGARVDAPSLSPHLDRLGGLPIFQSHGRQDRELSFSAADALREALVGAGADVSWWPFDGGHEIPLVILRELKKFIRRHSLSITTPSVK